MSRALALFIVALTLIGGCRSIPISPNADSTWVRDLHRADSIILHRKETQQALVDRETITRLADIYAKSKWEVYWHTLPGNLGERTIDVNLGGSTIRRMSYTGVLWEHNPGDSNRTTPLTDSDRAWLESLFDSIPNGDAEDAR